MSIKEIIIKYLKDNNYDGLYNAWSECACEIADLAPCVQMESDCEPGYKCECDCGENCDFHICAERSEEGNAQGKEKTEVFARNSEGTG